MKTTEEYLRKREFTKLITKDSRIKDQNERFISEVDGPFKASAYTDQHRIRFTLNFPNKDQLKFNILLKKHTNSYLVEGITGETWV
jgi:hypothetical protein